MVRARNCTCLWILGDDIKNEQWQQRLLAVQHYYTAKQEQESTPILL
jgi:hypothetical protein